MNLYFRLLWVLFLSLFRPRLKPLDSSVLHFRVWLHDLDVIGHMNNARYPAWMDLGRFDYLLRTGVFFKGLQRKWVPVVGTVQTRFRRSLHLFDCVTLETRMLCWDEKWCYLEQKFLKGNELVALGLVKGLLRSPERSVPPREYFELIGEPTESPPMPEGLNL